MLKTAAVVRREGRRRFFRDGERPPVPDGVSGAVALSDLDAPIDIQELEGSPTWSLRRNKNAAKRELMVPWQDADLLVLLFTPGFGPYGQFPGVPYLWVESIDVKPFPKDWARDGGDVAYYGWAHVTVSYAEPEWEFGDPGGPEVVLIHGFAQAHLCFTRQFQSDALRQFRIIAFDHRGHGASDKPKDPSSYRGADVWAKDVAAIL
ncbi:MAG: alpha/beta hydrolase, partial [Gemmataceae bacterium]|nr:alpha/beta hydrolase [Gemmataceae bacterium]